MFFVVFSHDEETLHKGMSVSQSVHPFICMSCFYFLGFGLSGCCCCVVVVVVGLVVVVVASDKLMQMLYTIETFPGALMERYHHNHNGSWSGLVTGRPSRAVAVVPPSWVL